MAKGDANAIVLEMVMRSAEKLELVVDTWSSPTGKRDPPGCQTYSSTSRCLRYGSVEEYTSILKAAEGTGVCGHSGKRLMKWG